MTDIVAIVGLAKTPSRIRTPATKPAVSVMVRACVATQRPHRSSEVETKRLFLPWPQSLIGLSAVLLRVGSQA